ncbi:putative toxin-antitoxin system toxin component, PIN family [Methylomagnum sp.]
MMPFPPPPRLVIDTNLVLSALVFPGGRAGLLRHAWQKAWCRPLICQPTAAELIRVLAYPKFKLTATEQRELLADYLPYCETVTLPARLPDLGCECRDADDLPFPRLAIIGQADALLSGARDLLSLKDPFARPILSADEWLSTLHNPQV